MHLANRTSTKQTNSFAISRPLHTLTLGAEIYSISCQLHSSTANRKLAMHFAAQLAAHWTICNFTYVHFHAISRRHHCPSLIQVESYFLPLFRALLTGLRWTERIFISFFNNFLHWQFPWNGVFCGSNCFFFNCWDTMLKNFTSLSLC